MGMNADDFQNEESLRKYAKDYAHIETEGLTKEEIYQKSFQTLMKKGDYISAFEFKFQEGHGQWTKEQKKEVSLIINLKYLSEISLWFDCINGATRI